MTDLDDLLRTRLRAGLHGVSVPRQRDVGQVTQRARKLHRRSQVIAALVAVVSLAVVTSLVAPLLRLAGRPVESGATAQPSVLARIPVGPIALSVAAGGEGVWATSRPNRPSCEGEVARIDRATNRLLTERQLEISPEHVALGYGSVWLAGLSCPPLEGSESVPVTGTLLQLDARSADVIRTIRLPGPPSDVVAGADGVWVSISDDPASAGTILRISPDDGDVIASINVDVPIRQLAVGSGAVWVQLLVGEKEAGIARIDPAANSVVARIAPGGHAFAVGHDSLWAAGVAENYNIRSSRGHERVAAQFDPMTNDLASSPVVLEGPGTFLPFAVDESGVWFIGGRGTAIVSHLNESGEVDAEVEAAGTHAVTGTMDTETETIWLAEESTGTIVRINVG